MADPPNMGAREARSLNSGSDGSKVREPDRTLERFPDAAATSTRVFGRGLLGDSLMTLAITLIISI